MGNGARHYSLPTIKRLFSLSGNQCAAPDCTRTLTAVKDGKSIIAKICHIETASPQGARYNPNMTDEERAHFNNLILLCDECHCIIDNKDNEAQYPVALLKDWKRNHESVYLQEQLRKPSLLIEAIDAIASANFESEVGDSSLTPFNISDKISYNNIQRNKFLIEEYAGYNAKITAIYSELETAGSFKKEKLLSNIRALYLRTKGKYVQDAPNPVMIIQAKADDIIEDIEKELLSLVDTNMVKEDITFGISVIMVDAFMRCKILEEPKV